MKNLKKKKKEEISQNASNVVFVYDFEHSKWFENKNDSLQMIDFALWRFIIDVALKKNHQNRWILIEILKPNWIRRIYHFSNNQTI